MTTATDAGFLAAILASPDDDVPRLAYADWLDEHGDPARAEFIRVQCALLRPGGHKALCGQPESKRDRLCKDPACDWCRLRRRERELLGPHWSVWMPTVDAFRACGNRDAFPKTCLGPSGTRVVMTFRRGFVESVTCTCVDWLAHGPAVVARAPVTRVTLSDRRPQETFFPGREDNRWWWCEVAEGSLGGRGHFLPPQLFRRLAGGGRADGGGMPGRWYLSERAALDALPAACLACAGRGAAGGRGTGVTARHHSLPKG